MSCFERWAFPSYPIIFHFPFIIIHSPQGRGAREVLTSGATGDKLKIHIFLED
jgi:hypothetical protein